MSSGCNNDVWDYVRPSSSFQNTGTYAAPSTPRYHKFPIANFCVPACAAPHRSCGPPRKMPSPQQCTRLTARLIQQLIMSRSYVHSIVMVVFSIPSSYTCLFFPRAHVHVILLWPPCQCLGCMPLRQYQGRGRWIVR